MKIFRCAAHLLDVDRSTHPHCKRLRRNADHNRVEEAFEESRKALGLEQLDAYLMHWPASPLRGVPCLNAFPMHAALATDTTTVAADVVMCAACDAVTQADAPAGRMGNMLPSLWACYTSPRQVTLASETDHIVSQVPFGEGHELDPPLQVSLWHLQVSCSPLARLVDA